MIGTDLLLAVAAGLALTVIPATTVMSRRQRQRRQALAETAVRPILFEAIDRGDIDGATIDALDPVEQRALEALARSLLPKLRGTDHDTLANLLDRRGSVDVARRHTRSRRASVRARAGQFLGEAGSSASVHDLVPLLHDPNPRVRWTAARALGRLGHPQALTPLLGCLEGPHALPADVVVSAVFDIRQCPVAVLRQGSRSTSVPMRAVTVELLGRFQALAAVDDVVKILRSDPSLEVRARAAQCLGRLGSPRAVEPLLACLDTGPTPVRAQALWALGEIGAVEALPVLRATLLGPSRQMSEVAATGLASLGQSGRRVLNHVADGEGQAAEIATATLARLAALQPTH